VKKLNDLTEVDIMPLKDFLLKFIQEKILLAILLTVIFYSANIFLGGCVDYSQNFFLKSGCYTATGLGLSIFKVPSLLAGIIDFLVWGIIIFLVSALISIKLSARIKHFIIALGLCLMVAGLLAGVFAAYWNWGMTRPLGDKRTIELRLDKNDYQAHETVKIMLINNSSRPIWYNSCLAGDSLGLRLYYEKGQRWLSLIPPGLPKCQEVQKLLPSTTSQIDLPLTAYELTAAEQLYQAVLDFSWRQDHNYDEVPSSFFRITGNPSI